MSEQSLRTDERIVAELFPVGYAPTNGDLRKCCESAIRAFVKEMAPRIRKASDGCHVGTRNGMDWAAQILEEAIELDRFAEE